MKKKQLLGTAQPIIISNRFDNRRYFQLAVVLDRSDCLKDINELRAKFLDYTSSLSRLKEVADLMPEFRNDITFLALKYSRSSSFESVMLSAVLSGNVRLKNYKPVHFQIYESNGANLPLGVELMIVLDQFTTKNEIDQLFSKEYEKNLRKLFQFTPHGLNEPIYKASKNADNVTNIKRDRIRYWRNVRGESYAKIALSELNEVDRKKQLKHNNSLTDVPGVEGVKRSIQRYKKLLTVDI